MIYFFIAFSISVIFRSFFNPFNSLYAFYSTVGLTYALIPLIKYFSNKSAKDILLFIPMIMTYLYFLLPYMFSDLVSHHYKHIPIEYLDNISFFSMASLISLYYGYYALNFYNSNKSVFRTDFVFDLENIKKVSISFMCIGIFERLLIKYATFLYNPIKSIFMILEFSPVISLSLGLLYYLRGGKSKIFLSLILLYFFGELSVRIGDTLFSKILYMFASFLLVYVFETKKLPVFKILLIGIIVFPNFALRKIYRAELFESWYGSGKKTYTDMIFTGFDNVITTFEIFPWEHTGLILKDQLSTRFENITFLGQCVDHTLNDNKGYRYGATMWHLPLSIVPRFIFPWKPINYHATLLATEYGVKGIGKGAMNFPMLAEYFINFGFYGMVFFSFIQGLITRWALQKAAFGKGDLNLIVLICLLWHLEKVETNFTMIMGGFIQIVFFFWLTKLILRFFNKNKLSIIAE